jgi:phytanoyl-CoA hydroxylase
MDASGIVECPNLRSIDETHVRFFRENGFLIIHRLLGPDELQTLSRETSVLVARATEGCNDADYFYKQHQLTGKVVPYRIEYIVDKIQSCRVLLAHPFLLRAIECLQGRSFIPTWDSLVFKLAEAGIGHEWHRDAAPYTDCRVDAGVAAIDVGIYLDPTDLSNCLWLLPGSNQWSEQRARAKMNELGSGGFDVGNAVPVLVNAGDAIFHNILTLHGSAATRGNGRRVAYYEFRQISAESQFGPHIAEYIRLKQRVSAVGQ